MWMIFALGAKACQLAGDAVVEPGADGDQQIALLDGVVGVGGAVHAEHVQRQRAGSRRSCPGPAASW